MSSEMREKHAETLKAVRSVFDGIPAPCAERDALDFAIALLARTEAGADGVAEPFGYFDSQGLSHAGNSTNFRWLLEQHREGKPNWGNLKLLYTHPHDASGNAAPVLFGRDSGGDWYVDTDTKSICVDVDFDPARQLSLVLKQDGSVAWSIFVQEPDSSTTKATGPSVMNPGFYEALSYIAMQAKETK